MGKEFGNRLGNAGSRLFVCDRSTCGRGGVNRPRERERQMGCRGSLFPCACLSDNECARGTWMSEIFLTFRVVNKWAMTRNTRKRMGWGWMEMGRWHPASHRLFTFSTCWGLFFFCCWCTKNGLERGERISVSVTIVVPYRLWFACQSMTRDTNSHDL